MGATAGRPGPRHRRGGGAPRPLGPVAELPRRRGTDRHAALERGHPDRGDEAVRRDVPPLEGRPRRGDGPPGAAAARPAALPQGPVPLPLLHPPGRPERPARAGCVIVARARVADRPAPTGASPVDVVDVATEGPGPTALLVRGAGCRLARPTGVLDALSRSGRAAVVVAVVTPS